MIKGWISNLAIITPMKAPKSVPTAIEITTATKGCMPNPVTSSAIRTPTKAIIDPTERSIPPDRMTNVMPTAVMIRNALSVRSAPRT